MYLNYIHLADVKGIGVNGGGSTSGAWRTRDLNTEFADTGNLCVLAGNQFTLQAGTYRILASAPAFNPQNHQIRLYNITDAALEMIGDSQYNESSEAQTRSILAGRFTIAAPKVFEIQHRVANNKAVNGLGITISFGAGDNIYTVIELWEETP